MLGWGLQRLDRLSHSTPPVDPKPNDSFPLAAWLQRQRRDHWLAIGRILIQIAQPSVWATASLWVLGNFPVTRWLQARIFDALEAYLKLGLATLVTYIAILLSYIAVDRATAILTAGTQIAPRTRPRLQQRVLTLSSILKSFLTVLLVILGAIVGLAGIGVDVGPLIAGAGLIGVALSLASQNLIKDAINGFLILAEDQFSVGDAIAVGNLTGRVEALTLRVTKLRDAEQRLIVIPNSEIRTVANLSNHYSQADLRIPIAYGADLDQALAILNQLSDDLAADPQWSEILLDRPQVLGIDEFSASGSMVRVWIRTTPLQQWGAAREFRRRVAIAFNAAQIGLMGQTDPPAPIVPLEMEDNGARDRAEERDNAERDTLAQQSQPRNPDPTTTTTKSLKSDSNGQGTHHAHAPRDRDGGDPAPIADGMTASAPNPGADLDAGPIDPSAKTS
nr:mechanosensitive ion channel family protein [Limnothrix sp. FACHB-881]